MEAVVELARCARSTFDIPIAYGSDDERAELREWWRELTRAIACLRAAPRDPALGKQLLECLKSPSEFWFRADQVAHIAVSFERETDAPSFADHLLFLLEKHADESTPRRLTQMAHLIDRECDCNGAEMVVALRALAAQMSQ